MHAGGSTPHWGTHPMLTLESKLVYGPVSYLDWLQAPTEAGGAKQFYVPTVRGLWPGQFLNVHGGPGYGGGVTRAYIQSLGYDKKKQLHYFVADTELNRLSDISVLTQDEAQKTIAIADAALQDLDKVRADLGSVQNQLNSTIANVTTTRVNVMAAESSIREVDFADEASNFTKMQVLMQASTFALAQANANSQNVLSLLQ